MSVRPVVAYGKSVLATRTRPVEDISGGNLRELVGDMFDTMYEEEGIGLAANQVGVDLNLMVIDITHVSNSRNASPEEGPPEPEEFDRALVFANGEILERWGDTTMEEGCLSLPGIRVEVKRSEGIRFAFQEVLLDAEAAVLAERRVVEFRGFLARVIQHEMDHLNGLVILDRAGPLTRQKFSQQIKQLASR